MLSVSSHTSELPQGRDLIGLTDHSTVSSAWHTAKYQEMLAEELSETSDRLGPRQL